MNFPISNFRRRLAHAIYHQADASALIDPAGSEYAYHSGYEDTRLDAEKLLAISEMGDVDRILWQLIMLILHGREMKIITPESQDKEALAEKSNEVLQQLWRIDAKLDLGTIMAQTWVDQVTEGSGLVELGVPVDAQGLQAGWGNVDGWKAPEWAMYLDAPSFQDTPASAMNPQQFVPGRILGGIVWDIKNREMQYWQTQRVGEQPKRIPSGRILHIKDRRARYPDGKSYLAGIAPTVAQLETVRASLVKRIIRTGVPPVMFKVNELRDEKGDLLPDPFGKAQTRFKSAYDAIVKVAKNWGNNVVSILWPEHEAIPLTMPNIEDMTKVDAYFLSLILKHLIPRDWVEQNGQAISKSSTPLLDLAMMVVRGWREIISEPYEKLYTAILEANGFADWAVEFTYKDLDVSDKGKEKDRSLQAFIAKAITLDRFYEETGRKAPSKEERADLEAAKVAAQPAATPPPDQAPGPQPTPAGAMA
jgi:hypothetical protein